MIKYAFGEIFSSGGATLCKNPSDQTVRCLFTILGESGSLTSKAFGNLTIIKCGENEFTCTKDGSCIDETKRCDLFQDCPNNEDELNCRK